MRLVPNAVIGEVITNEIIPLHIMKIKLFKMLSILINNLYRYRSI